MFEVKSTNVYDDGNIPDVDLPQSSAKNKLKDSNSFKNSKETLTDTLHSGKDDLEPLQ